MERIEGYTKIAESIRENYPRFSDKEYERRYRKIRDMMEKKSLNCLIIYGNSGLSLHNQWNIHYVSNYFDVWQGYVVFPLTGELTQFCGGSSDLPVAKAQSVIKDVRHGGTGPDASLRVAERVKELKLEKGKIGIVDVDAHRPALPLVHYNTLQKELPNARFEFVTQEYQEILMIPSEEEMKWFRKGCELTDLAVSAFINTVKPGVKEYELFAAEHYASLRRGGMYFFSILGSTSMSNPNMSYPRGGRAHPKKQ
jgi:Xaa-Pro aminopeptidase